MDDSMNSYSSSLDLRCTYSSLPCSSTTTSALNVSLYKATRQEDGALDHMHEI
jgi:hypothetical protein